MLVGNSSKNQFDWPCFCGERKRDAGAERKTEREIDGGPQVDGFCEGGSGSKLWLRRSRRYGREGIVG